MDTTNPTPETDLFPDLPVSSSRNIALMIAGLVVIVGFFLPWFSVRGIEDYEDFKMPTLNGLYLLSVAGKIPEVGWLFTVFLAMIPLGGIMIAFNSYQHSFSEKVMMFGIAAAIFLPLSLITVYLILPTGQVFREAMGGMKVGIGLIIMALGAIFCLVYAIIRIARNMQGVAVGQMFKIGAIGGIITGVIIYLILSNMSGDGSGAVYLYLFIMIAGILLTVYVYSTNVEQGNYHSGQVVGFIFSAIYTLTLVIIASIEDDEVTGRLTQGFIFLFVYQSLFGFITSSLVGTTEKPLTVLVLDENTAVDPQRPSDQGPWQG